MSQQQPAGSYAAAGSNARSRWQQTHAGFSTPQFSAGTLQAQLPGLHAERAAAMQDYLTCVRSCSRCRGCLQSRDSLLSVSATRASNQHQAGTDQRNILCGHSPIRELLTFCMSLHTDRNLMRGQQLSVSSMPESRPQEIMVA